LPSARDELEVDFVEKSKQTWKKVQIQINLKCFFRGIFENIFFSRIK